MAADRQELEDDNDLVQNICTEKESVVFLQIWVLLEASISAVELGLSMWLLLWGRAPKVRGLGSPWTGETFCVNTTGLKTSESEMSQLLLLQQGPPSTHSVHETCSSRLCRVLVNEGRARQKRVALIALWPFADRAFSN